MLDGNMTDRDTTSSERAARGSTAWSRRRPLFGALLAACLAQIVIPSAAGSQEKLRIVTTLPTYASIAKEIAGDLADVEAIARGDEDAHFVTPRPSFAALIKKADLLLDGASGYVAAYAGVELLDIPAVVSRGEGDVHVFGNPHIHTDPINTIIIGRNILAGLRRIDADRSATYEANASAFEDRLLRRLFGERLVEIFGNETLFELARTHRLWSFLEEKSYQERPLTDYLGGWLAEGFHFRDREMACYHKNWIYFTARFRVDCGMYVEPKVGIPPSPGHVRELIDWMAENEIPALLAANFFSRSQIESVAARTGAAALIVPHSVGGAEGVDDYFALVDLWVSQLAEAFAGQAGQRD
jgi:ABC-type Zn uptake system ZnuABC Zn-binding protein ZnuA